MLQPVRILEKSKKKKKNFVQTQFFYFIWNVANPEDKLYLLHTDLIKIHTVGKITFHLEIKFIFLNSISNN